MAKWTMVVNARDAQQRTLAGSALESLRQAYWYPLYAYVRRRGYSANDAQDLTQAFFAEFLLKSEALRAHRVELIERLGNAPRNARHGGRHR